MGKFSILRGRIAAWFCGICLLLGGLAASQAWGVAIAVDGRARAVIVVDRTSPPPVQHAAEELASFLGQVTGGTFEVAPERRTGAAHLYVGPRAAGRADPEFSTEGLGMEGIVLRTLGDDGLILAGGEPRGTLYAVYTFLEQQVGCRWWTPAASTIPRRPTLEVESMDLRYVPPLEYRETDAFDAMDGDWSARAKFNGQHHALHARHGGKYSFEPGFCHTFYSLIPPARYFKDHPEWFSLINGERNWRAPHHPMTSLCLTNEEMRRELVTNLRRALRAAPAETASTGLSEVRFYLADGKSFVGNPGPGQGWDTSNGIRVTASSRHPGRAPVQVIDGSGLDSATGLLHGTDPNATMFMSGEKQASAAAAPHPGAGVGEHWIAFEFDRVYALGDMWIWNYNENKFHLQGMRHMTLRCSTTGGRDPAEWTTVFTGEIPEAIGLQDQPHHIAIDFGGASARYVVFTAHDNWGGTSHALIAEVSQPDDAGPPHRCTCITCAAIEEEEGGGAGVLIRFVNAVAADIEEEFPGVPVSTLAYHYTQKPPAITRPRPDVFVRLCSIKCSFSTPLANDRNAAFRDDVVGWSKICPRLYIWDYVSNFSYILNPHPNLRVLGPNIRFLVEQGAKGYLAEALPHTPGTEMAELRSWVLARLMWDPNLDGQALIEEFVQGYYGSAARPVLDYIELMHDAVEASGDWLGLSSPPDAEFLSLDTLSKAWKLLADAERAAGDDPDLGLRVRVARLPVMYVFLMRWDALREEARSAQSDWLPPDSDIKLHEKIQAIAGEVNINLSQVPSPIPF